MDRVTERGLSGLWKELATLLPQPTASGSASAGRPDSDDDDCDVVPAAALPDDLHPDQALVKFFPQGTIQTMKIGMKLRLLRKVLSQIDTCSSGEEVLKTIIVKDAIDWISGVWNDTSAETIQKCFAKASFIAFDGFERQDTDSTETVTRDQESLITEVTASLRDMMHNPWTYINGQELDVLR